MRSHGTSLAALLAIASLTTIVGCDPKGATPPSTTNVQRSTSTSPSGTGYHPTDVATISVEIYEGSAPGPAPADSTKGAKVIALLPDPLPPSSDETGCSYQSGTRLSLHLRQGNTLVYGPCALPTSLEAAAGAMFQT